MILLFSGMLFFIYVIYIIIKAIYSWYEKKYYDLDIHNDDWRYDEEEKQ